MSSRTNRNRGRSPETQQAATTSHGAESATSPQSPDDSPQSPASPQETDVWSSTEPAAGTGPTTGPEEAQDAWLQEALPEESSDAASTPGAPGAAGEPDPDAASGDHWTVVDQSPAERPVQDAHAATTPPQDTARADAGPAFPVPVTMSPRAKKFGWSRDSLLAEASADGTAPPPVSRPTPSPAPTPSPSARPTPEVAAADAATPDPTGSDGSEGSEGSEGEGPFRNVVQVVSPYLRRHRTALITGGIALLLSVWLLIALPFPLKYAVDAAVASTGVDLPALSALGDDPGRVLTTSVIVLGALLILQVITRFMAISALGRVGARIATSLRSRLLAHLHRLTPGSAGGPAHAGRSTRRGGPSDPEAVRPLIDDVAALRDLLSHSGPRAAASALTVLSLLVVTVILDPLTALVLAVTGALFALAAGWGVRRERALEARSAVEAQMLAETADELVAATGTIQSYGLESRSERGLTEAGARAGRALTRARRSQALLQLFTVLVGGIGVTGTLLLGGPRVAAGTMTPGDLVMLLADLLIVIVVLRELLQHGGLLTRATAAGDRIAALLAQQAGITEPQRSQPVDRVGGEIVFSAINTALAPAESPDGGPADASSGPEAPEGHLFDTVSLVVPAGQHVALLDREGHEAAALIAYLLRFDQPDTGRVLLDRFDTRAVSLTDLRRQMAVVQREPVLFTDTVRENIRIGRPDATDAEVEDAARRAGIDDVIAQLAHGFDTVLVSRGSVLTDGQRRRIAIARAQLRDAPIVVLDAADAGLSGAERRPVMAALATLVEGRTAIVSSRDPETVTAADRVLWFEDGDVREDGAPVALAEQEDSRLARWLRSQDESV